ncbi:MAG: Ig-like domain-containing protein [Lachnospiraceae bacterium]|nr:Ig-like domain-containing protein [Lachnospiraceae bacterium]
MKKVFAVLLAIALICSAIPVAKTDAATLPKLNAQTRLIYVGGSSVQSGTLAKGYYTLKVKNKAKKYSCSWSTDNAEVVKVEKKKGGKAKITALNPGTAVVTANYVDKVTDTRYALTCTVTVVKNCAALAISGYNGAPVKVGTKIQLDAILYDNAGKELENGKQAKEFVKWATDNSKVAEVSDTGIVTAVDGGKAEITCYTVQAESGTYSKISKATAKKTITIEVEQPDIPGIADAYPKSLKSVEVVLGSEKLGTLTKDNFSITADGGYGLAIKSMTEGNEKGTFVLETEKELSDGISYTVVIKNTPATVNLMKSFTFTKGIPVSIAIDTPVGNNKVIAGKITALKFRVYNAQGVDITPSNELSDEYLAHKMCIRYTSLNAGNWFVNDGSIYIYDENQTVQIGMTYSRAFEIGNEIVPVAFEGQGIVYSVSEASTVTFDPAKDIVFANVNTEGSKLKFEGKDILIPSNDDTGNFLIARVKNAEGKYVYSNEPSSPIEFEPVTTAVSFVETHGKVNPNTDGKIGTDEIKVLYNRQVIGTVKIAIIEARKASTVVFDVGGGAISTFTISDVYGIGATKIRIKVLDQYGNPINVKGYEAADEIASTFTVEKISGPYTIAKYASDGNAYMAFEAYGYGSTQGSTYQYKVVYNDKNYGSATGYFNLIVKTPMSSIPSSYSLRIEGDTDISLGNSISALPKIDVYMYELKDNLIVNTIKNIYTSETVIYENNYFYRLYKAGTRDEIKDKGCVDTGKISPIYETAEGKLAKLSPGKYQVEVYKKTSAGTNIVATETFTITDDSNNITITLINDSTKEKLSKESVSDISVLRAVVSECFEIKRGNDDVPITDIYFPSKGISADQYGVFFPDIIVTRSVTIGNKTYTLENDIEIRQYIKAK